MDSHDKLKKIKNPYKESDVIFKKNIRISALKSLGKLHSFDLTTRKNGNTKVDNIFIENKPLVELLEKDHLSIKEVAKVNKLILDDYGRLQKDLDSAFKAHRISKKLYNKEKNESAKILYNLGGVFKNQNIGVLGKKSADFCLKHKIKVTCGTALVCLLSGAAYVSNTGSVNASIKSVDNKSSASFVVESPKISKDNSSLDNYKSILNSAQFSEFDKIDTSSKNFEKSRKLYLGFMKEVTKSDNQTLKVDGYMIKAIIKAEYLYNSGIKNHLEGKIGEGNEDETRKKIELTEKQLESLKNGFNNVGNDDFTLEYEKHGEVVSFYKSEDNQFIVEGLKKFSY